MQGVGSIEAVLFDFGGVFTPSPFHVVREASRELGIPPEVVLRVLFGGYDQDTDHPWHRLERGEVSAGVAIAEITALAAESGHALDPIAMLVDGMGDGGIREDVVELVREVRRHGLKTAIVTNNIRELSAAWQALLPVDELFDLVVDSCEEGVRKPDPRIFRIALERLGGVAPENAVFLDDAVGNVAAARALGIRAIHVGHDHEAAVEELRTLLAA
jgi:epoxide hydrolase-like predicted phosphatase